MIAIDLTRRAVLGAATTTMVAPASLASFMKPDPIHEAIRAAVEADTALTATLVDLDEDDAAMLAVADAAADALSQALDALAAIRPTTQAGLVALIRFYAEDAGHSEPYSAGAASLGRLLAVIEPRAGPA